jgi:hypothetical protein
MSSVELKSYPATMSLQAHGSQHGGLIFFCNISPYLQSESVILLAGCLRWLPLLRKGVFSQLFSDHAGMRLTIFIFTQNKGLKARGTAT